MTRPDDDELSFLTRIPLGQSVSEVCMELARACARQGMPTYSIGGMVPPGHPLLPAFHHHNWPESWTETFARNDFAPVNPIPRIAATSARTVTITEYRAGKAGIAADPAAEAMFAAAARIGRGHALIVPIHGPRGPRGAAVFNGPGPDPDLRARGILGLMGHVAFARLAEIADYRPAAPLRLTPRETAALRALARGLTDSGIAAESGTTIRTVRFHLANARAKLGARTRGEALAAAARNGLLDGV